MRFYFLLMAVLMWVTFSGIENPWTTGMSDGLTHSSSVNFVTADHSMLHTEALASAVILAKTKRHDIPHVENMAHQYLVAGFEVTHWPYIIRNSIVV